MLSFAPEFVSSNHFPVGNHVTLNSRFCKRPAQLHIKPNAGHSPVVVDVPGKLTWVQSQACSKTWSSIFGERAVGGGDCIWHGGSQAPNQPDWQPYLALVLLELWPGSASLFVAVWKLCHHHVHHGPQLWGSSVVHASCKLMVGIYHVMDREGVDYGISIVQGPIPTFQNFSPLSSGT